MKQKYSIYLDDANQRLVIEEYAELDKDMLSMLYHELYPAERVQAAVDTGKTALMTALRTHNFYPPGMYLEKIADAIIDLWGNPDGETREVFFDNAEYLAQEPEEDTIEEVDEESDDIDELLDDGLDEEFGDEKDIPIDSNASLKIADDESLDVDDES